MSRFIEPTPETMSEEQREVFRSLAEGPRGKVPTPYKIWLSSPRMVRHLEQLGVHLLRTGALSAREVEIATLLAARQQRSEFVAKAHRTIALRMGMDATLVDALLNGAAPSLSDAREQTVHALSQQLLAMQTVDEALFTRAVASIGHAGIAELSVLLGYYAAVAMTLHAYDITVPQNS